ncbi:hypothetical protein, partial [Kitasatospora purpeofusca]|uniref:hypothetical protein n=1 Tax=Kitasatospora purpeofusca TaxID=67352 RepID=UPI003657E379
DCIGRSAPPFPAPGSRVPAAGGFLRFPEACRSFPRCRATVAAECCAAFAAATAGTGRTAAELHVNRTLIRL